MQVTSEEAGEHTVSNGVRMNMPKHSIIQWVKVAALVGTVIIAIIISHKLGVI